MTGRLIGRRIYKQEDEGVKRMRGQGNEGVRGRKNQK